jgi:hypothetical protein
VQIPSTFFYPGPGVCCVLRVRVSGRSDVRTFFHWGGYATRMKDLLSILPSGPSSSSYRHVVLEALVALARSVYEKYFFFIIFFFVLFFVFLFWGCFASLG